MNFKLEILGNFEFSGYQICQQTVHKITKFHSHFQLKSKREGRNNDRVLASNEFGDLRRTLNQQK